MTEGGTFMSPSRFNTIPTIPIQIKQNLLQNMQLDCFSPTATLKFKIMSKKKRGNTYERSANIPQNDQSNRSSRFTFHHGGRLFR